MPPVLTSRSRRLDSYHHSFTNSTPMPDGYSALNEGTLLVTDEEDGYDTRHWPDETGPSVGEDVVRTGEASRLRRRGAVHGRRPQFSYVSLVCGAPLPWQFKFKDSHNVEPERISSLSSLNRRYESLKSHPSSSKDLTLEFPSTGCRSALTTRAYVSSSHLVYSASAPLQNVAIVNKFYLDEEQKRTVTELLVDTWGHLDWQGLACSQCGNIVGFRYAPTVFNEQGSPIDNCVGSHCYIPKERFAFFPSAITPSKPYDFTTQQHFSSPYYWRYLEPLSTTAHSPHLRPFSEHSFLNQDPDSENARPFQYHHPTSFSQGQFDPNLDPRPSLSIRSISPSSLNPIHPSAWGDPLSHVSREPEQLDDSWATWYPDPAAYATDEDDDEHVGQIELSEAISILRTTHGDIVPRLQLPLPPSLDHSQAIDHLAAIYASDEGDVFRAESTESGPDLPLQGQHASNVPQVGDEHAPFRSDTPQILIEEQTSSDNQHGYAYTQMNSTPDVIPGQRQPLTLLEVHMLGDLRADDSQAHYESERVHDIMLQQSDSTQVMQPVAEVEPTPEQATTVQPNPTNVITVSSDSILPTPLSIVYGPLATVVDVEGNRTGEMESVGTLAEVGPPPPSSTSGLGSGVVAPLLIHQANTESDLRQPAFESSIFLAFRPNHAPEVLNNDVRDDPSDSANNIPSDVIRDSDHIIVLNELDVGDEFPSGIGSVSYQHYTPPLPSLTPQALMPSLQVSPSRPSILPSEPLLSSAFPESIQDESSLDNITPEVSTPVDSHDIEDGSVSEKFEPATAPSVNMNQNEILQSYLIEEAVPSEHDLQNESERSPMELRLSIPLVSPSRPGLNSSSPTLVTAAPASQPQPLPADFSTQYPGETTAALSIVSQRLSDYASPATSSASSQQRSSSRRSWRTPRESIESPQPTGLIDEDDVDDSVSRRSNREFTSLSHGGTDYGRETRSSASRRVRGNSRIRRRRLSSSSRREPHISTSTAFHTPWDAMGFIDPSHISTLTSEIPFQQRIGGALRRFPGLNTSPELIRRGSLPNIDRPRLANLVRRDSLPVLSIMRREPLSDLTTTYHQREFVSTAAQPSDPFPHPPSRLSTRYHSPVSVRGRFVYDRPSYEFSNSRQHDYDAEHEHNHEESLVPGHENNPINDDNDPEEALTPRPRRHTTMPVFIPTPPSDSDSEPEDNAQNGERISYRRGSNHVPWMPWEWCWQDQHSIPLENGLQVEVQATQPLSESDKEES